ncbi:hypothetical protein Axi01nite_12740 [Actinoplanes xinjiangensis]|nr:hypothetical protein Axi01nite_12740 [Actinoplanes xinjiangensis]
MFLDFSSAASSTVRASGPVGLGDAEGGAEVSVDTAVGAASGGDADEVVQPAVSRTATAAARAGWYDFTTSPMIDSRR